MKRRRALIIGGGIGGAAAGLALIRVGWEVTIFEKAAEPREIGAGLTVWPNAMKALRLLGLEQPVWAAGRPFGVGRVYDRHGRVLVEGARRDVLEARFGWPGMVLHRQDLLRLLMERLPLDVLRTGSRCLGLRQDRTEVAALFDDGREERGDLLIGADGLNSTVRAALFGQQRPRYAGYAAYRGINRYPLSGDIAYEAWGVGQRFGFVPGPGSDLYWWAAVSRPPGQPAPAYDHKQDLLKMYAGWFDPIADLLKATPDGSILCHDIYDRPPVRRWSLGRATLLGDAAHPVTPDLGQGACLAFEDAVILGSCLATEQDIPVALMRYEERRTSRARFLARHSRGMGWLGQLGHPALATLRNVLVRRTPAWASLLWLSWQFAFDPS